MEQSPPEQSYETFLHCRAWGKTEVLEVQAVGGPEAQLALLESPAFVGPLGFCPLLQFCG